MLEESRDEGGIGHVHPCASESRSPPDDGMKIEHVRASATIDMEVKLNVADLAKRTPGRRA